MKLETKTITCYTKVGTRAVLTQTFSVCRSWMNNIRLETFQGRAEIRGRYKLFPRLTNVTRSSDKIHITYEAVLLPK